MESIKITPRQRGIALLSVVLVVALLTVSLTLFSEQLQRDARRLASARLYQQARWLADSGELIALQGLRQLTETRGSTANVGSIGQKVFPVEGGTVSGELTDLRTCFNLNSLLSLTRKGETDPLAERQLRLLLSNLAIEELQPDRLLSRTVDWIDDNVDPHSIDGAEDQVFQQTGSGYYSANAGMIMTDELLAAQALTPAQFKQLGQSLCALPDRHSKINVNGLSEAQAPLLAALLFNHLSPEQARQFLKANGQKPFTSRKAFLAHPSIQRLPFTASEQRRLRQQITTRSDLFRADIKVHLHQLSISLHSVLMIKEKKIYRLHRYYGEI